ncbi:uncharacterized protein NPIL_565321 [Nephila pilipes]|uniref:Reverse transcriptase n=1 Tax=Nephila pilipes TaxID=299642 RepID=A0A8X6Q4Y3_NEPPI|nr:uncharacterized protein NPIL_565321 [Nephila pilipes]
MKGNKCVYDEYKNIVQEHLNLNIVEECASDLRNNSYYMPHSAVVRSDKETTKVRLVFDASSKGKECKSVNDCLSSEPTLNLSILDVLLKFREYQYAFSSDIQGAFFTIGIDEKDRDYLRYFGFQMKMIRNRSKF